MKADANHAHARGSLSLGERLGRLRESADLSQRNLGRRIGRSHSVISRWESGSLEPTILDLEALGRHLRVGVDDLLLKSDIGTARRRWSSRSHSLRDRRSVGAAIRAARSTAGITVRDVYRETSIGGLRLLRLEEGADPSLLELVNLCRLIGVSPGGLLQTVRQSKRARGDVTHRIVHETTTVT